MKTLGRSGGHLALCWLVLATALSMPVFAWLSQSGVFGPDNATISDRYPSLIVPAGYAFSIWGPIFLLDAVFGVWQVYRGGRDRPRLAWLPGATRMVDPGSAVLRQIRVAVALGFGLTASWMIAFSLQIFWLALAIIWIDFVCLAWSVVVITKARRSTSAHSGSAPGSSDAALFWFAAVPLSLHAGWLGLAAFLNLAQVVVAWNLFPASFMPVWNLALLAVAALVLLDLNRRMAGNVAFALAATWGLVGVFVKHAANPTTGAAVVAWFAMAFALALVVQTLVYRADRWLSARTGSEGVVAGRSSVATRLR